VSIIDAYATYRDRAYRLLNEFVPVQHSLDVLTGNSEDSYFKELRKGAGFDFDEDGNDDEETVEDEDDESGDG
jgi:hypothetical protein